MNPVTGAQVGKLDIDEANNATDIEFSADGTVAYVVDLMFNSYHVFNTKKGQDGDVTTLFGGPSAVGPGGADPNKRSATDCVSEALTSVVSERPFRMAPQAGIDVISGYVPVDTTGKPVNTGIEFDAATYQATGHGQMIPGGVPDGIGTTPIGVRLSPDGQTVYVANYLARNVVGTAAAQPQTGGKPANFRCTEDVNLACATSRDCSSNAGFCNHPGGGTCNPNNGDADCTASGKPGPCVAAGADCVPLILAKPVPSTTRDPLPAQILDGKNLFNTAARDASVMNTPGLSNAAPLFNDPRGWRDSTGTQVIQPLVPGAVVSTSHDASYVTCTTCHADFGGQDGRTWDFCQFGGSLRNTMDLRGRPGFAPGTCSNDSAKECTFDAACGDGAYCKANPSMIPPNVTGADRERYFNPMLTVHWNGDRDEVEDFEATYRSLMGAGDCDGAELTDTCLGALIQRSALTTSRADGHQQGPRRTEPEPPRGRRCECGHPPHQHGRLRLHADRVPGEPERAEPGGAARARLFNDSQTLCASCHQGGPPGKQFFTDKAPRPQLDDPSRPGGADANNPFRAPQRRHGEHVRRDGPGARRTSERHFAEPATDAGVTQDARRVHHAGPERRLELAALPPRRQRATRSST